MAETSPEFRQPESVHAEASRPGSVDKFHAVATITSRIVGSVPPVEHARETAEQIRSLFAVDACVIRLLEGNDLVLFASAGLPKECQRPRISIGWGIALELLNRRTPLLVTDVASHPVLAPARFRLPNSYVFETYAGAPMLAGDSVIGVLGLYSVHKRDDLSDTDLDCLQIMANSMSVAVANERAYAQLLAQRDRLEQEIASRHRAEELIVEHERRFRLAAEAARMFAFEWDLVTDEVRRSADCVDILGLPNEALVDTGKGLLERVHPEDRASLLRTFSHLRPDGPDYAASYRVIRSDGRWVWLEERAQGLFDDDGKLVRLVGMAADVTRRKLAEDESRRLRDNLARATQITTMGELAATIAHEVNQPLGAIMTNAQACRRLLDEPDPDLPEVGEGLDDIVSGAIRANSILNRVRTALSKGNRGQSGQVFKPIQLNDVVQSVARTLSERVETDRVALVLQLDASLPLVRGDRVQLEQVLLNLVVNAFEAVGPVLGNARQIGIHTRRFGADTAGVAVHDRGVGISPENQPHIFDPFYTSKPRGMGMGLAICRSIVEGHGGRIWVESVEGKGSVFQFALPVAEAERA